MKRYVYPGGKRFAFTIMDDTDVATVDNILPMYRLMERLGFRTTKTVWPLDCPEGSRDFSESETLEDDRYREFVVDLQARGFEIAFHGATMESSERERTLLALERFREILGQYPRVHANHAYNRENMYWGVDRFDHPLLRLVYGLSKSRSRHYYQGHIEGSPYWWGDVLQRHIEYVRNLTFDEINLLRVNPTLPYWDPERPLAPWWFSASDADNVQDFQRLVRPERQDQLEREGGVCIIATHLGKGYVRDGEVDPVVMRRLEALSRRDGWFVPVGELLDWLRSQHGGGNLPREEWSNMQWGWGRDLVLRKLRDL